MPAVTGKRATTKEGISENIRTEINSGKKPSQAKAIAYSYKRAAEKKARTKHKK